MTECGHRGKPGVQFAGAFWCYDCAVRLFADPGDAAEIPASRRCRCGQDAPLCDECETYHCAGCEHPSEYITYRFAPLACGCVEKTSRAVCRTYGLRGKTTTKTYTQPVSRCAAHSTRREARQLTDAERRDYVMTGGRATNRTGD